MTDIPYTSSGLDDWCPESGIARSGSNWMGVTGLVLGLLALGAAVFAALAPRDTVERVKGQMKGAVSQGTRKLKDVADMAGNRAEEALDTVSAGPGH